MIVIKKHGAWSMGHGAIGIKHAHRGNISLIGLSHIGILKV
jgi:hypothetical protein